jgi:hypothetical protein
MCIQEGGDRDISYDPDMLAICEAESLLQDEFKKYSKVQDLHLIGFKFTQV